MNQPYINTYLLTTVAINPSQMDNNIRNNIKSNLIKKITNKCFSDYGYIMQIHDMTYINDAKIISEDPISSAVYNVKFLCTLYNPLINSVIIGTIKKITQKDIRVVNGPVDIIIRMPNYINTSLFKFNTKINEWTILLSEEIEKQVDGDKKIKKYEIIKPGKNVKVKILAKRIINNQDRILCIGYLENIASDEEVKQNIIDTYNRDYLKTSILYNNIDEYIEAINKSTINDTNNNQDTNNTNNNQDTNNEQHDTNKSDDKTNTIDSEDSEEM